MNKTYFGIILLLVLSLISAFMFLSNQDRYVSEEVGGKDQLILPDFPLRSVHSIRIQNRFETLTLKKGENGWSLLEREDYPVQSSLVHHVLTTLSDLKVIQKTVAAPENLGELGLLDPSENSGDGIGTRVSIQGGQGYRAAFIVGELQASHSEASTVFGLDYDGRQFIRLVGSNEVCLLNHSMTFLTTLPASWMQNTLSFPYRCKKIAYYYDGKEAWSVSKSAEGEPFLLKPKNEEQPRTLPNVSQSIEYTISSIPIKDVKGLAFDAAGVGISKDHFFHLETPKGDVLRLYLGSKTALSPQEKARAKDSSGMLRYTAKGGQRFVQMEWLMERQEPPADAPPYADRVYLIGSGKLDELMITHEEMIVFDRLTPGNS